MATNMKLISDATRKKIIGYIKRKSRAPKSGAKARPPPGVGAKEVWKKFDKELAQTTTPKARYSSVCHFLRTHPDIKNTGTASRNARYVYEKNSNVGKCLKIRNISMTDDMYNKLKDIVDNEGWVSVPEFVRWIIHRELKNW